MSQPEKARPAAWVDKLFAKLTAIYGSQKVAAMWVDADMDEVRGLWGQQLAKFRVESIAVALQRLVDSGSEWPPTLPEFSKLCRESAVERAAHAPALPAPQRGMPRGYTLPDVTGGNGDGLRWLRRVGHVSVARALPDIARRDPRARAILERHIADDFSDVTDPAGARYLREWVAAHPNWREACSDPGAEDEAA